MVVLIRRITTVTGREHERQHGVLQRLEIDLGRDFDPYVSPRQAVDDGDVDQVANGERHVGFEIGGVLIEDNVLPRRVEVAGGHFEGMRWKNEVKSAGFYA